HVMDDTNTINVGASGNLQGIQGTLILSTSNHLGLNNVTVDDSADPAGHNAALQEGNITDPDFPQFTIPAGIIHGLAPADINLSYAVDDTLSLTVKTGTQFTGFTVSATEQDVGFHPVTNLIGNGFLFAVVGDGGSVQNIQSPLNISNSQTGR